MDSFAGKDLRYEAYIDDQFQIEEIWNIVEALLKPGEVTLVQMRQSFIVILVKKINVQNILKIIWEMRKSPMKS